MGARTRRRIVVALAVACGLLATSFVTGCGEAAEKFAERGVEKAIEEGASGDADVDIDTDSGEVKVEGEDGSFSMGSGDIPESFPDDVPLPEGDYEVVSAMEVDAEEGFVTVSLIVPDATAEEILEELVPGITDAGYEQVGSSDMSSGGDSLISRQFAGNGKNVALSAVGSESEDDVTINYNISDAEEE